MLGRSECQRASPQQQTGMGKGEAGKRERAHRQVRESGSREILDRLSSPMRVMGMALHGPLFRQPARSPTHQSRRRAMLCGSKAPRIFPCSVNHCLSFFSRRGAWVSRWARVGLGHGVVLTAPLISCWTLARPRPPTWLVAPTLRRVDRPAERVFVIILRGGGWWTHQGAVR